MLNEGVAALGAAGGGLLLATNADQLALPGAVGYDETVLAGLRTESRDAELPAAAALRSGEPVWLESRAERDERFPRLAGLEATTVALCAVPLEVQGRRLGALRFSFDQARLFDEDERRFVLALAAQTAQALDRAQLQRDRIDVSRRLQRSLLPPSVPVIPGLDVAAVYHPFGDGMEVGGDFYDIWPVRPGQWAVAIGDATGTGPEAAGLTALVRHTLRALAMSEPEPPAVMATLNTALFEALPDPDGERFCTAIFGLITVGDAVEVWAAGGGHPPPVVRRADGRIETPHVGGSLLGVFGDAEVESVRVRLDAGDTMVLLTDGVLEARRDGHQFDISGVERVLGTETGDAAAVAVALESAVLRHTGGSLTDDMAILVLRVPRDTVGPVDRRRCRVMATEADQPTVLLAGGAALPLVGLGTWEMTGSECYRAVRHALEVGYRHIDTATMYRNEREVGRAVHDSGVRREDVFVTTKLRPTDAGHERRTLDQSLRALGTDFVDLWLIHWPPPVAVARSCGGDSSSCATKGWRGPSASATTPSPNWTSSCGRPGRLRR